MECAVNDLLKVQRSTALEQNLRAVWQGIWDCLCGKRGAYVNGGDVDIWQLDLDLHSERDDMEPKRVAAAWRLGSCWAAGNTEHLACLVHDLQAAPSAKDRAVMQALESMGAAALPTLLCSPALRRSPCAVRAMGRALDLAEPHAASHEMALGALAQQCSEAQQGDRYMRLCSVEAIGSIHNLEAARILFRVAEQDSDGDVRATACHSLLRLLQAGVLNESLATVHDGFAQLQGDSEDRYVAAYAAEGVNQVRHRLAKQSTAERAPTLVCWSSFGDGWACKKKRH